MSKIYYFIIFLLLINIGLQIYISISINKKEGYDCDTAQCDSDCTNSGYRGGGSCRGGICKCLY